MGSLNIQTMRSEFPGQSDADAAKAFAQKHGYIAIIRYKSSSSASDFTDIGVCQMEGQIQGYLHSPYCHDAEIIYDGRSTALRITNDLILKGHCELCGKQTTQNSLQLMAGNDFYICSKCGSMFCDSCYVHLPLTSSPGYGMCPRCRVKVQRAIPGFYGEQSSTANGTSRVNTSKEADAEYAAQVGIIKILNLTDPRFSNSLKHPFRRKLWRWFFMPLCTALLLFLVIVAFVVGIKVVIENIGIVIGGAISLTVIGISFYLLIKGVNHLIENQDLREAKRDAKNAELAKREREKRQVQLKKDIEGIVTAIKEKIKSKEPIENVLLNINTKRYEYEAIAKAILVVDFLKETEKGRLFNKMSSDTISHILHYFNDSEIITILQQIDPKKREDVLMRFPLSRRSRLNSFPKPEN